MNKKEKAREFCLEVKKLAKKYGLPFFIVTDGALLLVIIIVVLLKMQEMHILNGKEKMVMILLKIGEKKNRR